MIEQNQQDREYDVYYKGTKEQLFSFLYPLTGPDSSIFSHLNLESISYDPNNKKFQAKYEPKDFENIDKQKQEIVYTSQLVPIHSNYFYSTFQPQNECFVWQSIDQFVEFRPKNREAVQGKEKQIKEQAEKIKLDVVSFESQQNIVRKEIEKTRWDQLKQNWEVSRQEYLMNLSK